LAERDAFHDNHAGVTAHRGDDKRGRYEPVRRVNVGERLKQLRVQRFGKVAGRNRALDNLECGVCDEGSA